MHPLPLVKFALHLMLFSNYAALIVNRYIASASRGCVGACKPADRCDTLFPVMHTSASLALNESWDPDVRDDMEMMLNKIVPEGLPYRHSCEGPDDMVSA